MMKSFGFSWLLFCLVFISTGLQANLSTLMAASQYQSDKEISHTLSGYAFKYGDMYRVIKPNSDEYLSRPDRYHSIKNFTQLWESGLRDFCLTRLPEYQSRLLSVDMNNPDAVVSFNNFRNDFKEPSTDKVCKDYSRNIRELTGHNKDFLIPYYLDKYVDQYYGRAAKDDRYLGKIYADLSSSDSDYRIGLGLSLKLAIYAYQAHGGDADKAQSWRERFEMARNGFESLAKQNKQIIAKAFKLPNDRFDNPEGQSIRAKVANAFQEKYQQTPTRVILQKSIFNEQRLRMLTAKSGRAYQMMPVFIYVEGRDSSEVHFGFYEEDSATGIGEVHIIFNQYMPGSHAITASKGSMSQSTRSLSQNEVAAANKINIEQSTASEVAEFEAKALADVQALSGQATLAQGVVQGMSHQRINSVDVKKNRIFTIIGLLTALCMVVVSLMLIREPEANNEGSYLSGPIDTLLNRLSPLSPGLGMALAGLGALGAVLSVLNFQLIGILVGVVALVLGFVTLLDKDKTGGEAEWVESDQQRGDARNSASQLSYVAYAKRYRLPLSSSGLILSLVLIFDLLFMGGILYY